MAADIQVILEVLGAEDMEKAARATVTLTNKVDRLGKQLKKGVIDNTQFQRGVQQLIKKNAELGGGYKNLQKEVQRYAFSMQRRINEEIRAEAAVENVIRTTNNYTQATNRATVATTNAAEAAARHAAAQRMAGKSTNRFGMYAQQVGYQVGDFFVQVQSGTNALVAFGQQGTQLAGLLPGLGGAIVGIGLSLGTMLGGMWMRTRDAAEEVNTEVITLSQSLDQFDTIQRRVSYNMRSNLEEAFSNSADAVGDLLNKINQLDFKAAMDPIKDSLDDLSVGVDQVDIAISTMVGFKRLIDQGKTLSQQQQSIYEDAQNLVQENLSLAIAVEDVQEALKNIGKAKSTEELIERIVEAKEELERFGGPVAQEALDQLIELAREAGVAEAVMNRLADAAGRLGDELSFAASLPAEVAARAVRIGVESGAIPPHALQDLPQTDAEKAYERLLERRRTLARTPTRSPSSGGGGGSTKTQEDYVGKLLAEAEQKRKLIGLSEEETRRQEILYQLREKGLPTDDKRIEQIIQMEAETRKLIEAEQQREQMMTAIQGHIESAFMSFVDGSKSVEDAFKSMLRNIILEIYQTKVAKPAANAIMDLLFSAKGNVFSGGAHVKAYADGGVVNRTTAFPMRGGVGIMGEAGPEAIMPLKRGKNGKLGVQMEGSSGATVVNNYFNVSANGDDSVKRIIRGEIPRITEATKAAVVDAKRRGGSYGRSF